MTTNKQIEEQHRLIKLINDYSDPHADHLKIMGEILNIFKQTQKDTLDKVREILAFEGVLSLSVEKSIKQLFDKYE